MTKKTRSLAASLLAVLCAAAIGISDATTPETNAPTSWAKPATMSNPDPRNNRLAEAAPGVAPPRCGVGCKLFNNTATLSKQSPSPFRDPMAGHAETTSVFWNAQYFMYYRTFISPAGTTCTIPQGVAMATSADRGSTWTAGERRAPVARPADDPGRSEL